MYTDVNDIVTDWSYAFAGFLVSTLFGVSPGHLAIFHIAFSRLLLALELRVFNTVNTMS